MVYFNCDVSNIKKRSILPLLSVVNKPNKPLISANTIQVMMLIQGSFPGSVEAALSFASDHGKDERMPGTETWQNCPEGEKSTQDRREVVPVTEGRSLDDSCCLNFPSGSQLSTVSWSKSSTPAFVYRRRKLQRNYASSPKLSDSTLSSISSEAPSVVAKEGGTVSVIDLESDVVGAPVMPPGECSREALVLKSESVNGSSVGEELCSKEAPEGDIHGGSDCFSINDSSSSSKSNMELGSGSLRTEADETGECASSSALVVEGSQDDLSEKDIFIGILIRQGLLKGSWSIRNDTSAVGPGTITCNSHVRKCKVCDHSEATTKMLICDQCEEAFHVSCCNPHLKKIPIDEWFCHSCLKRKHKILETSASKELGISSEMGTGRKAKFKGELGQIESMLIYTDSYTPGVRIGQDFQAEVPDWSGPLVNQVDAIGEPLEINSAERASLLDWNSSKPSRRSTIGNWLQCQEVLEGIGGDGRICGKWRRAPLFEVQTDDWECFRAVLWDPAHADCAVPQELDTDQVLKHLKCIEMVCVKS